MKLYNALKDDRFRKRFLITLVVLIILLICFTRFLLFIEARQGVMFTDPVLNLFNAVELNYLIFGIIYGAILYGLYRLSSYPEILLSAIQTYVLMVFFRMAVMYVVPLEQPAGVIDLKDPLVFIFGTGQKITKDLFFSGHTATLFILFLNAPLNKLKYLFLVCTIIVGTCVLIQKAHYTIDVLAAPAFAYCSYSIIKKINP